MSAKRMNSAESCDIGVIGLAVMGQNLILNMNDHGFLVAVFNRTVSKVDAFMLHEAKGTNIVGCQTLESFVNQLDLPRRIMLMVKAGDAVDEFINLLRPYLQPGDIIIDGGNSLYTDTERRCTSLEKDGLRFVGCGVSGGEDGARHGPSLMPGGSAAAWSFIQPIFQSIAAKVQQNGKMITCCQWIGPGGSGHFVKMVHNGIEYADIQLICEAYHILKTAFNLKGLELADIFAGWKNSEVAGFLIDISTAILSFKESPDDKEMLVERIRDAAGQKGTGKWTVIAALDHGVDGSLFSQAVFARSISAQKEEREKAAQILHGPHQIVNWREIQSLEQWSKLLQQALYCSKTMAYAQGFALIQKASTSLNWKLNFSGICETWMGGCIIRSSLLNFIQEAFQANGNSQEEAFLYHPYFVDFLARYQTSWRQIISTAVLSGMAIPEMTAALEYYDMLRTDRLPANLLQGMRDYFGAHTYELLESPGVFRHSNWTGHGGSVSSSNYQI